MVVLNGSLKDPLWPFLPNSKYGLETKLFLYLEWFRTRNMNGDLEGQSFTFSYPPDAVAAAIQLLRTGLEPR